METLIFLFLLVIVILIVSLKNSLVKQLRQLEKEMTHLQKMVADQSISPPLPVNSVIETPVVKKRPIITNEDYPEPVFKNPEQELFPQPNELELQRKLNELTPDPVSANPASLQPALVGTKYRRLTFFERNPDFEKFIGENLVSKIGIGILVLAIAYFVKYAIDNDWIGPIGRVGVGMVCGGILISIAHRLRNNYKAFSSVLVGGGLAIFYFTIALAYHQFHLFSQTPAFVIMVVITTFAVILSLLYNRQEVAIIAMVGGFATPFIVSNGSGHYKTLFIYLLILNAGLLVLAYKKGWRLLNFFAFIFTVLIFGGWLGSLPVEQPVVYKNGFLFATIFYLLFFVVNIAHNLKENKKFIASDFGIILSNTCLYFLAGLYCIYQMQESNYKGIFSIAMAVFNLSATYLFLRKRKTDTNVLYLLIGITLTFLSLTAPLQLQENFITLFWAAESVLLLWLFQKSKIRIVEVSFMIVWVVALISLVMDWFNVYFHQLLPLTIVANKGFVTTFFVAAATYVIMILKKRAGNYLTLAHHFFVPSATTFYNVAAVLFYLCGAFEINYQFNYYYPFTRVNELYLEIYTIVFVYCYLALSFKKAPVKASSMLPLGLLSGCLALYLLLINANFEVQLAVFLAKLPGIHFNLTHWMMVVSVVLAFYRFVQLLRRKYQPPQKEPGLIIWILSAIILIITSVEANHFVRSLFYKGITYNAEIQRVFVKTVLPILWGFCSFGFMWLGMHYKLRQLRIFSLSLFLITLIKLFLFDIRNIPVAGKIAAFFCLGVLLLIVSFMYQRLKKIIIENKEKPVE